MPHKPLMIVTLLVLSLSSAALAQHNANANAAAQPLSTDLLKCVESGGAGITYLKACASPHGNLILFKSPWGMEHIRVGAYDEGYAVCYQNSLGQQSVYDVGPVENGWAEPYRIDGSTFPLTIYRKTLDGQLELVQQFTRDGQERDVTITMTLFNRSSQFLSNVMMERHADFDVDNAPDNECYACHKSNWFERNPRSIVAWNASSLIPGGNAVSMTNLTMGFPTQTLVEDFSTWAGYQHYIGCQMPNSFSNPGDNLGAIRYFFSTMAPNSSKTVKIVYRAF